MTKLLIKITPEVLERAKMCGTKEQPGFRTKNCAIAIAIRDIFPDASAGIDAITLYGNYNNRLPYIDISYSDKKRVQEFMVAFDSATPEQRPLLPPFSFTVELPDEVVERIDISDIDKSLTLELV
jgi:hypothetical protein